MEKVKTKSTDEPLADVNLRRGQKAAASRRGKITKKDITKVADELKEIACGLEAEAASMDEANIKSMEVDGVMKAPRGIEELRGFVAKVNAALGRAKWQV